MMIRDEDHHSHKSMSASGVVGIYVPQKRWKLMMPATLLSTYIARSSGWAA
ncbi:MAG: hypothetical protein HOW73_23920 [Polyangiaceae bacterium]|nr:hypothetical protein [Polyangiaceae bacterium]